MLRRISLFGLFLTALCGSAAAQQYPVKPVRMIAPIAPGGAADIVCRMLADRLTRSLGQQFVVENLPGATGVVGAQAAARAVPDGYTIYFGPSSSLATAVHTFKSLPYDPAKDFVAISMIVTSGPSVIAVHPDVPAKTLAELIALAKSKPGALSYGVDVSSGLAVTAGRLFTKSAGIQMTEVSYKAGSQAMIDVMAGQVQAVVGSAAMIRTAANSGKVRRLAISSDRRFPGLDDLPTMAETLPGVALDGFFALVAPTGTPAVAIRTLNREMDAILKDPVIVNRLLDFGLATTGAGTPESTDEFLRVERDRWGRVIRELGIEKQ